MEHEYDYNEKGQVRLVIPACCNSYNYLGPWADSKKKARDAWNEKYNGALYGRQNRSE